ncbi:hypothetical protein [Agriterribacter sp.]|uniref:hypothetical protein n=1 Tax=Agriterribacter sp. TaxID=2821509 RepID=UPI002C4A61DE|nr:hypothetical protein [Agriterribacter sp.]HRO45660.1 hypothetical protein [Agriterribacter sp.]HRQ17481.1 hypothetical protein [Agriterribacter sp.]
MNRILLGYLIIVCLVISCKKDDTNCNNSPWYQDGVRLAYKNDRQLIGVDSIRVFVKKIARNKVRSMSDVGFSEPEGYLEICGNKVYKASSEQFSDSQLLYDLNGNIGDKWTVETTQEWGRKVVNIVTLKEKSVSVTVPYGTFSTTMFEMETSFDGNFYQTAKVYITEDHGPVKLDGTIAYYELGESNF